MKRKLLNPKAAHYLPKSAGALPYIRAETRPDRCLWVVLWAREELGPEPDALQSWTLANAGSPEVLSQWWEDYQRFLRETDREKRRLKYQAFKAKFGIGYNHPHTIARTSVHWKPENILKHFIPWVKANKL